jgi:hypothetical protein
MKLCIYLNDGGLEAHALGHTMYSWHYSTREDTETPPKNSIKLAEVEVVMPRKESCIAPVLAKLKEREDEINASAHEDLMAIQQRKNDLLMLTCEVAA